MQRLGRPFDVRACEIDERSHLTGDVVEAAQRVARAKFDALAVELGRRRSTTLITADTLVASQGAILGKPRDDEDAEATLRALSGQSLRIVTGLCIGAPGSEPECSAVETSVELRPLDDDEIESYVASGEARDKAGSLALQGGAWPFVRNVYGCWSNVVGLPLCAVTAALERDAAPADRCSVGLCGAHR